MGNNWSWTCSMAIASAFHSVPLVLLLLFVCLFCFVFFFFVIFFFFFCFFFFFGIDEGNLKISSFNNFAPFFGVTLNICWRIVLCVLCACWRERPHLLGWRWEREVKWFLCHPGNTEHGICLWWQAPICLSATHLSQ